MLGMLVKRRLRRRYTMFPVRGTSGLDVRLMRRHQISLKVMLLFRWHENEFVLGFLSLCENFYLDITLWSLCRLAWSSLCSSRFIC